MITSTSFGLLVFGSDRAVRTYGAAVMKTMASGMRRIILLKDIIIPGLIII
jgi:hypothetical protein